MRFRFVLLGAGRMGRRHAENIMTIREAKLVRVFDTDLALARKTADDFDCLACDQIEDVFAATDYDGIIIATPTNTHVDLILRFAEKGTPILCEKPLDLDLDRARMCVTKLAKFDVPVQIAFNRRFDPSHSALARAVHSGEIGKLQQCILTSRDQAPPPPGYIAKSGGMFFDTTIHDFDMMRFITQDEPISVTAVGAALFDEQARENQDIDTHSTALILASGAICQINGCRRSISGHDQRIEVAGDKGMLISQNQTATSVERYDALGTGTRGLFIESSRDRYREAYRGEVIDFIQRVREGLAPAVTVQDGYRALVIAAAATRSLHERRTVEISY